MENSAAKALSALFGEKPALLKRIGGGAYGAIFLARLPRSSVCVKVFFRPGDAAREALWYRALKRANVCLPHIFGERENCLVLEYIPGTNASLPPAGCDFDAVGEQAAADIARLHSLRGKSFGQITSEKHLEGGGFTSWRECYQKIAAAQFQSAENAARAKLFSPSVPRLFERVFARFDDIFVEPPYPALVHGDLNAENIMISKTGYLCLIDPINSLWGDPELELFQLTQNGGDRFRLLERYAALRPLSPDFPLRSACYAAFAEADWFADIRRPQDKLLNGFLNSLQKQLQKYGFL